MVADISILGKRRNSRPRSTNKTLSMASSDSSSNKKSEAAADTNFSSVLIGCSGVCSDDGNAVDINVSEVESYGVDDCGNIDHDLDGYLATNAGGAVTSADEFAAMCSAEYFEANSAHDLAETDALVAQMMDNPDKYRPRHHSSAALSSESSSNQAANQADQCDSTNHVPITRIHSGCHTPVTLAMSALAGDSSSVYLPGSELRLRAKRPNVPIRSILKDVFGFDDFRDKQEDVINLVLSGQSCLCVPWIYLFRLDVLFANCFAGMLHPLDVANR
jgi:hypothetical protein